MINPKTVNSTRFNLGFQKKLPIYVHLLWIFDFILLSIGGVGGMM